MQSTEVTRNKVHDMFSSELCGETSRGSDAAFELVCQTDALLSELEEADVAESLYAVSDIIIFSFIQLISTCCS